MRTSIGSVWRCNRGDTTEMEVSIFLNCSPWTANEHSIVHTTTVSITKLKAKTLITSITLPAIVTISKVCRSILISRISLAQTPLAQLSTPTLCLKYLTLATKWLRIIVLIKGHDGIRINQLTKSWAMYRSSWLVSRTRSNQSCCSLKETDQTIKAKIWRQQRIVTISLSSHCNRLISPLTMHFLLAKITTSTTTTQASKA